MAARKAAGEGKKEEQASEDSEEEEEEGEEEEEEEELGCCEYDSTWEEEEEEEDAPARGRLKEAPVASGPKTPEKQSWWSPSSTWASGGQDQRRTNLLSVGFRRCKNTKRRNWMAARDMQKYRRRYPDLEETDVEEAELWNLSFYKNEIRFMPNGLFIDDLLEKWQNDYGILEENHSYIQWLFPLREQGMNWRARLLTCQEIEAFKKSKEVMDRFVRAYKLMLGFYGIDLVNEETGELRRAENWCERFENLNRYSHNNLRITRILKCLGEMGYENYQVHLVQFFLTETLVHHKLPNVLMSALDYFMFTVRSKEKRRDLVHFAWQNYKPKREFSWGPHKKLRKFKAKTLESVTSSKVEKVNDEDDKEVQLERKALAEESGAETENLKESKKRKLEMSKLSGECNGVLNSPTDIEKISCNLKECVIDQKSLGGGTVTEETSSALVSEGEDGSGANIKETETVSTVIKRRKMEELALGEDAARMSEKEDAKLIPSKDQETSCSTSDVEKTNKVCQDETKVDAAPPATNMADGKSTGEDSLVDSQTSTVNDLPPISHTMDKPPKPETTSSPEKEESVTCDSQPAVEREVDAKIGPKEESAEEKKEDDAHKNVTADLENTIAKPKETENIIEKPEETENTIAKPEGK
nr:opioid growth factor receptor [Anolis sagrei ordinatus]